MWTSKTNGCRTFSTFLIQQLRNKGIAFTTTGAKAIIVERKPIIWNLLQEIMRNHPVLLNRAPTLHRLGIQAFIPKLVDGKAILLHPLVCPAFNADFDGDQMAVHVPLSPAAKAEAFNLLLACNHMLAPSSGQPLLLPTQDMVLGCYYLTISKEKSVNLLLNAPFETTVIRKNILNLFSNVFYFSSFQDVLEKLNTKLIDIHTPIWVRWSGKVQNFMSETHSHDRETPCELRVDCFGNTECLSLENYIFQTFGNSQPNNSISFIRTTPGRILLYKLMKGPTPFTL